MPAADSKTTAMTTPPPAGAAGRIGYDNDSKVSKSDRQAVTRAGPQKR
jgi:hypothetical protein